MLLKRLQVVFAAMIVIGVALMIAGILGAGDEDTAVAPAVSQTTTPAAAETSLPATTKAPTTTRTTTSTRPPFSEPIRLSGRGTDVVDLAVPDNAPAIVQLRHAGSRNFSVASHDAAGNYLDLLVNTIGPYSGTRPVNLVTGDEVAFLEITADGLWSVDVLPLAAARQITTSSVRGAGDDVVIDLSPQSGAIRVTLSHNGDRNFSIWAYSDEGRDLLVNEIGAFDGTVLGSGSTFIYDITADGDWVISLG